jgi:invasion protein IalB
VDQDGGEEAEGPRESFTSAKESAGAPAGEEKQLCSTIFEVIESNTGQLLASVRLEEIEGAPKRALAVTVPLGVVIPAGVKLAVYNADQWARAVKNEMVELKELKTIGLRFSHCLPLGCTAEAEATEEVSDLLKGNAGIGVLAIWTNEHQLAVPVPLSGFAEALAGKPVDNKEYQENRRKLVDQIHQRQIEIANKAKAEEMKTLPPPDNMTKSAPASAAKK